MISHISDPVEGDNPKHLPLLHPELPPIMQLWDRQIERMLGYLVVGKKCHCHWHCRQRSFGREGDDVADLGDLLEVLQFLPCMHRLKMISDGLLAKADVVFGKRGLSGAVIIAESVEVSSRSPHCFLRKLRPVVSWSGLHDCS